MTLIAVELGLASLSDDSVTAQSLKRALDA